MPNRWNAAASAGRYGSVGSGGRDCVTGGRGAQAAEWSEPAGIRVRGVGALVQDLLVDDGWKTAEPWTPLRRDLTETVGDPGVRIEVIGPEQAHVRTAVQRASFDGSLFTDERRHVMAAGLPYADARCLVA
ncbi:hypothetical protein [Streptomyces sp. NPDC057889]|uniref:hypothetical protein n=1 Tax=unclassified Streptomyces TaxID=2593676 RepID=UPI00369C8607